MAQNAEHHQKQNKQCNQPPKVPPNSLGAKTAKLLHEETKQAIYTLLFLSS